MKKIIEQIENDFLDYSKSAEYAIEFAKQLDEYLEVDIKTFYEGKKTTSLALEKKGTHDGVEFMISLDGEVRCDWSIGKEGEIGFLTQGNEPAEANEILKKVFET
jgi:hypothetical protein